MKEKSINKLIGLFLILSIMLVSSFVLVHPSGAAGNAYYVAKSGNDSNPGTQALPWLTIQKAANTVIAGDTVNVAAGTYSEKVSVTKNGSSGSPILFQAQGVVELKGFVLKGDYLQVKGFTIKVLGDCSNGSYGIKVIGTSSSDFSSDFLIENNNLIETNDSGVFTDGYTSNGVIRNNYFYRNQQDGIEIHGVSHLVEGNEVVHPVQVSAICSGTTDDADGMRMFGTGHIVRLNNFHDIHYGSPDILQGHLDCIQMFGGWVTGDPAINTNILIERNYCEALSYQAADENGNGFQNEDVGSSDGTFAHGIIIRNNMILAFMCSGAQENSSYVSFINNTCITRSDWGNLTGAYGLDFWGSTSQNHHYFLQNNIFYNFKAPIYVYTPNLATTTKGYNLAYNPGGATPDHTGFHCNVDNDLCADPLLVDLPSGLLGGDYHLQASSPAINSGAALTNVPDDYDGNTRPSSGAWDRGAYEYGGVYSTPTATSLPPTATNTPLPPTPTNTPSGTLTTIFSNDFETALNWTASGDVVWYTGTPKIGTHSVQLKKVGAIEKTISTVGYDYIAVSFYLGAYSLDNSSENVQALWYDGSSWVVLKQINDLAPEENNSLNPFTYQLPQAADNNPNLALRFKINGSGTADYGYVDDVAVTGYTQGPVPTATITPIPPSATNTSIPPTATNTSIPPTATDTPTITPIPPTATNTPVSSLQQIFLDDFETAFSGWAPSGGTITWYTGTPKNGTHSIQLSGNGPWMQRTISTVGYHGIVVRVYMGANSFEASEALKIFWWNGSWVNLKAITDGSPEEDGQLHFLEFTLPSTADNKSTFKLAFQLQGGDTTDYGYIDDVEVLGLP